MVINKKIITALVTALFMLFNVVAQSQDNNIDETEQLISVSANSNTIDESQYSFSGSNTTSDAQSGSSGYMGTIIGTLIALIAVVFALWWVLRLIRRKTNLVKDEDDFLRRAAYITVGSGNKTVEVITLVDRAYVIGVSDDKITLIDEITDEKERDKDLIEAMNLNADKKQKVKKPVKFSEVLDMFTKKTNPKTNVNKTEKSVFNGSESTLDELLNKANQNKTE